MKRILFATMILVLVLSLVACEAGGSGGDQTTTGEISPSEQPTADGPSDQGQPPTGGPSDQGQTPEGGSPTSGQPSGNETFAYSIVDTGQDKCYDDTNESACPQEGQSFYGQDAQYDGLQPRYVDNGDGTVTDLNTGLMWQQGYSGKMIWEEALVGAETFTLAGYDDWRLPTIKELYSLIDFDGLDPRVEDTSGVRPFIDTNSFDFEYGNTSAGERIIDAQYWSSTEYVATTMNGSATVFGVNFADGRIKGYGRTNPSGREMTQFVRYVRGNPDYGVNDHVDNGDGTISDLATGLTWQQADSGSAMDWSGALSYCENLEYAGYDDWRLPNAKELQSIVDYARSPDTTGSAAIDPLFFVTAITNERGEMDYPSYWTSTTHANQMGGGNAAYIAFGRAMGYMNNAWIDVHGAGAQRSDPKSGEPANWPTGQGPQGDAIRIYNHARCVRSGAQSVKVIASGTGGAPEQPPAGQQPPAEGRPPVGGSPPQEAISACSGLSENAACEFSTPRGTVTGTCAPIQEQLACVPPGGPQGD